MDITEFLAQMMLDLKMTLDTDISTAEATRCVNRAVDDLSRLVPRERIYETTYKNSVVDDSFTTPAATDIDKIVAAMDISASVDGTTASLATTWMDVPRPVKVTITDADNSITRMTLIVRGTDEDGVYVEERFFRHDGKVQTGKVHFYSIYEVEINEIAGNGAADKLDVGTSAGTGIWVALDYPIEPETEYIYSGLLKTGTKYVRDTDYYMDYANGRIQTISGGSMLEGTAYYATYSKSAIGIDISDILPDIFRIVKVVYPVDKVPEQSVAWSIWGNIMVIGSQITGESQKSLDDGEHIAIYYETRHAPPTLVGSGSFTRILDQVVSMGAEGYALLVEAIQYEIQAVTDLASARTKLALTTDIHTQIETALDAATVLLTKDTGYIDLALAKVATYLETNGSTDNAKEVLADITDDIANLRTAIATALAACNTYVDEVDTTDLGQPTVGAEGLLETGDNLINQLNDGKNVPEIYADFSRARTDIAASRVNAALGYIQEATARLANLRTYIDESAGWVAIGQTFLGEASQRLGHVEAHVAEASTRIAEIDRHMEEADKYVSISINDLALSDRFRGEGQIRLNQFFETLRSRAEYRKRTVSVPVRQPA